MYACVLFTRIISKIFSVRTFTTLFVAMTGVMSWNKSFVIIAGPVSFRVEIGLSNLFVVCGWLLSFFSYSFVADNH